MTACCPRTNHTVSTAQNGSPAGVPIRSVGGAYSRPTGCESDECLEQIDAVFGGGGEVGTADVVSLQCVTADDGKAYFEASYLDMHSPIRRGISLRRKYEIQDSGGPMPTPNGGTSSRFWGRPAPGEVSIRHWLEEMETIGPGLQAVMQWSQLVIESAQGAELIDADGHRIIDLMGAAGVNSIGHANSRLNAALTAELARAPIGAFGTQARLDMVRSLRYLLPKNLDQVQLYSGGAEAVEASLRLAKSITGKHEFLGFWGGFHGKTLGALALTSGARSNLGPLPTGFFTTPYANCFRCPFKLTYPQCGFACVDHARDVVKQNSTGALAAIVVEPVQGRSGNVVPPRGYLAALADLAHEFDAVLICDEMMTGFGRTGSVFAFQQDDIEPEIVTIGKGMGGGYPVSGVLASKASMDNTPFREPSASSSSFGGFPLACRAVATTAEIITADNLADRAAIVGAKILSVLSPLVDEAPLVGDVRGLGLAIGIELVTDKQTRIPIPNQAVRFVFDNLLRAGVLTMVGGNTLRLYPPLTISEDVAVAAAEIIVDVLADLTIGQMPQGGAL